MNLELRELYQTMIIDHGRKPRNFHKMDNATHVLEGFNPLCGDKLTLYLNVNNNTIKEVSFEGSGCAISMASASLMSEHLREKKVADAEKVFHDFHELVTNDDANINMDELGKLTVLAGVKEFPARVKCATLAWHTLHSALHGEHEPITTE